MTITAPALPSQVTALYDALHGLGSFGPTGDPLVCAALLRAVSTMEGLALREVAAVDAYGTFAEVGQPSAVTLVQTAIDCTTPVASGTVRLARRLDSDLRPVGELLIAGKLTRQHCAAVVHGVRGLDANIVTDSLPAICAVALATDPDTLARELRIRAEAISPALAEHARARLETRIGLRYSDSPDGTGHLSATVTPETIALLNAVLDATVHGARVDRDSRSTARRRHDAFHDLLRHAADCTGLALPSQGGCRAQITIIATAATLTGADAPPQPGSSAPPTGCSPTARSCGCCATPTSAPPTSAPTSPTLRWVGSAGPSAPPCGGRWSPETSTASPAAATDHPRNAKPTTSSTGPTAAPPTSTISSCSATNTTTNSTTNNAGSAAPTTEQ